MKNILIIFPNKLGDLILSIPFVKALQKEYPASRIGAVVFENFAEVTELIPEIQYTYKFSKKNHKGLAGKVRFARSILKDQRYDICFCLPHSFSAALISYFTGSRKRIGFRSEMRSLFLTHVYDLPEEGIHSARDALQLLEKYTGREQPSIPVELKPEAEVITQKLPKGRFLVFNGNSAKQSTRIPAEKAAELIEAILKQFECSIVMVGSPMEYDDVQSIIDRVGKPEQVVNFAGIGIVKTAAAMRAAGVLISTDTGIGHLGNVVGAKTIVIFGASNENIARPWNTENLRIIRNPDLDCAPCLEHFCKYGEPKCLTELNNQILLEVIAEWTNIPEKTSYPGIGNE